ncbi:LysR family transcriptional regulator [Bradyrhizobium brasilense]|uniref:Transcriptional regulator, LysR family n=1 Tax=Bradyrhizobium brasilense TaxID=1419277 RepID=A0A1G6PUX9_9BRAD|nr:LysR family transcriptional regulator [Bradyrhizobium brasilense]MCC8971141.1 LysR family transcriptional regulator [Bradyrhizobium brasilense]SDC83474.1 transcriptional regulator, LysR family [Bradyrhizobium brasilense]
MDRIDALQTFIRVMEAGSFSQAASDLGLGQPAISKRVALLEAEFGCRLFVRTTRKVRPTPEADRVLKLAKDIVALLESASTPAQSRVRSPSGTLRITVPTSFGRYFFRGIFAEYLRRYPDVRLDASFTEQFVDLVETGTELAIRIGMLNSSSLVARRVGTIKRLLVAAPSLLARHQAPLLPDHLRRMPSVAYSRLSPRNQWTFEAETGRHVVEIAPSMTCDDADVMTLATVEGLGVAVLPSWCAVEHIAAGRLVHVLPDYAVPSLPMHLVYPDPHWMSHRARLFRDLIIERADMFAIG